MGGGLDWFNDGVCESGHDRFCSVHPRLIFQQGVNFIGGFPGLGHIGHDQ